MLSLYHCGHDTTGSRGAPKGRGEGPEWPGPPLATYPALDFQGFFREITSFASLQHVCERICYVGGTSKPAAW